MNTSLAVSVSLAPTGLIAGDVPSPLERLRQRSANKRWEEVRGQWMPVQGQGLDIEGPKRVEGTEDLLAPPRPVPNLEAGKKPLLTGQPAKPSGVRTEDQKEVVETAPSQARPFPTAEFMPPSQPMVERLVPDPYAPEVPVAPEALTNSPSIHKSTGLADAPPKPVQVDVIPGEDTVPPQETHLTERHVETSEIPQWQPPQPEPIVGNATLESTVVDTAVPQLQIGEPISRPAIPAGQPLLITPPVMTAQAEDNPGQYLPPPVNPEPIAEPIAETAASIFRPITQIQPYHDYSPTGEGSTKYLCPQPSDIPESERERCPDIQSLPETGSTDRHFAGTNFHWQASNLTHNPLYFEDVSLERYGHTYPDVIQPFVSVGKFGLQVAGLPYQMALEAPHNERYALGYYRPGECAPHLKYRIPFNGKAAITAGVFYTGFGFLFP